MARLIPPTDGAVVRFYRIGHGDCFLIAFAGKTADKPVYVLIDCGYKPGSPAKLAKPTTAAQVWADIKEATGGTIDVAIITHEHQDHVNGITATNLKGITIRRTWLAWTEDRTDPIANKLRKDFKDKLYGLVAARHKLTLAADQDRAKRIDALLSFELGGVSENFVTPGLRLLGAANFGSNKKSMKLFRDRAKDGVTCIRPHDKVLALPGAKNARVFALGPPRKADNVDIKDLDPRKSEEFHAARAAGTFFAAAAANPKKAANEAPFSERFRVPMAKAAADEAYGPFFETRYGSDSKRPAKSRRRASVERDAEEVPDDSPWRRIDREWLYAAERLALDMNSYTNNTSLVLAFELGKGGKVLLFAADAQRGNWISWSKGRFKVGSETVTAKSLLARTVLYKVGHHGSHNATLNGSASGASPNLGWMATGAEHAREFTAMITAVRKWATSSKVGWNHPLPAIRTALLKKASGRVLQTDTEFDKSRPADVHKADWDRYLARVKADRLYFDLMISP